MHRSPCASAVEPAAAALRPCMRVKFCRVVIHWLQLLRATWPAPTVNRKVNGSRWAGIGPVRTYSDPDYCNGNVSSGNR
jgi:hypothetical protein